MKEGPDIVRIAALLGDPARANMLAALMSGKALTASELAAEAGVTAGTTSSHLRKLAEGGLVSMRSSGRHKYFTLADEDVAFALEGIMGLAASRGHLRTRTGPKDPALRRARVCYNHLAGDMGVQMFRSLQDDGCFDLQDTGLGLTDTGERRMQDLGLDLGSLPGGKAPLCRTCLDWSAREHHLAGRLGRGLLNHFLTLGWARRIPDSRVIQFTPPGLRAFENAFGTVTAR